MEKLYTEVLIFACNWDGWSCIETATNLGLHYPPSVKVVKVSCLTRVHIGLILNACEFEADGLMLLGCEQSRYRFGVDSECIMNEYRKTCSILRMLGMRENRLVLVQLPAFDGHGFVTQLGKFIEEIKKISAFKRARIASSGLAQDITVPSHSIT